MCNRQAEVAHLFPGTNRARDLVSPALAPAPVVVFALGNAGTTTMLQAGAAAQPNTIVCLLRADDRPESFIDAFIYSLGLSVPPRARVSMSRLVECTQFISQDFCKFWGKSRCRHFEKDIETEFVLHVFQ